MNWSCKKRGSYELKLHKWASWIAPRNRKQLYIGAGCCLKSDCRNYMDFGSRWGYSWELIY